jgi:hypothetical protein
VRTAQADPHSFAVVVSDGVFDHLS